MQQPIQRLDAYRSNITSQHGENGILDYLLSVFTITNTCLEVGASDGVTNSNTFPVWFLHQWRALLIEGSPQAFQALQSRAKDLAEVTPVNAYITPDGPDSLGEIAARVGFPDQIGILSIDIDSDDYAIFANLHRLKPEIVIIECNPYIPPSISYRDREGHPLLRHSAKAIAELGTAKGYRVVACTAPTSSWLRMRSSPRTQAPFPTYRSMTFTIRPMPTSSRDGSSAPSPTPFGQSTRPNHRPSCGCSTG